VSRLPTVDPQRLRRRVAQYARYAAVSVIANATTLTVLGVLVGVVRFDAGWSNVIATGVATIPSFELNRRWVWGKRGQRSMAAEVAPFWIWAFFELAVSSLLVHFMADHATAADWSRSVRTVAVEATSIGTTGALWVIQFFLFDRVLFGRNARTTVDPAAELELAIEDRELVSQ
jgi:putative flippase GtrA